MAEITEKLLREELGNPGEDLISTSMLEKIVDEEETYEGSMARAARVLANRFSLEADKKMGPISVSYQERADRWTKIAERYEERLALTGEPFVGGISKSDKDARESDSDRPDSAFKHGMFEIGGS